MKGNSVMNIKEARKKAGLTQKALSDILKIPKRSIENWEGGKRNCPDWCEQLIVDKILSLETYSQVFVIDQERIGGEFYYSGQKIFSFRKLDDGNIKLENGVVIAVDPNSEGSYYDENYNRYFELVENRYKINGDIVNQKVIGFVKYYDE